MADEETQKPGDDFSQETLRQAMKAFKKRLKLTSLDEDSRLGRGPFSGGHTGVCAIQPPDRFSPAVWEELCRQGKLRRSGRGLYELPPPGNQT
jgi:hypothetical protein